MLIFGRSPNVTLALLGAAFNTVVAFHVGGFDPTVEQISTVNALLLSAVLFVANTDSIVRAAGDAAHTRAIAKLASIGTRGTDSTVIGAAVIIPPVDVTPPVPPATDEAPP